LFSDTARFGERFELPVDVLCITLLTNANTTYDHQAMLGINSVNYAMVSRLMLPIASQRATQWQAVSFRIHSQLFLQGFSESLLELPNTKLFVKKPAASKNLLLTRRAECISRTQVSAEMGIPEKDRHNETEVKSRW
jgi:hypothetical protein